MRIQLEVVVVPVVVTVVVVIVAVVDDQMWTTVNAVKRRARTAPTWH